MTTLTHATSFLIFDGHVNIEDIGDRTFDVGFGGTDKVLNIRPLLDNVSLIL